MTKPSIHRELFGREVPPSLTKPINERVLRNSNPRAPLRTLIENELEARWRLLGSFLGIDGSDRGALCEALANAVFDGFKIVSGVDPEKYAEVLQILTLNALGVKDDPAAKQIEKRGGSQRKARTIVRDYQRSGTYWAIKNDLFNGAQVALVQSGLLDDLTDLGRVHTDLHFYYCPHRDAEGFLREIGPFQSSIGIAFGVGAGKPMLMSAQTLSARAVSEIIDQATDGVVVIDRPGGNAGAHLRAALEKIGIPNVPVIFATNETEDVPTPAVVVLDHQIPQGVMRRVDEILAASEKKPKIFTGSVIAQND